MSSDCHSGGNHRKKKKDYLYLATVTMGSVFFFGHIIEMQLNFLPHSIAHLFHSFFNLMTLMWWGLVFGVFAVGIIGRIPREYVIAVMGRPGTFGGLLRATGAGLLLDLCNHGILLVGMRLYERGASIGQVMAFLIASPWNSISLTIILFSLVGLKWTLLFVFLSGLIALVSGIIFEFLVKKSILPPNPYQIDLPEGFKLMEQLKKDLKKSSFSIRNFFAVLVDGFKGSQMILKWIVFGSILASLIQTFVPQSSFVQYFGPSLLGLVATLLATTIIEVCSEGSVPIAADLLNRAAAPGNSFTFLMAGVATDYTEMFALRETTKSWKITLFLPLITVPQVLVLGYMLNTFG